MSDRQSHILSKLRETPRTNWALSYVTGYPEGSIRRDIQALRRAGWNIVMDNGVYRLRLE